VRSGATTSRQPRRRLAAIGLVLLAGVVAGGAVLVVSRIERDLDRRIARSLREAGAADVVAPVRLQDGVYRTETLGLWLAGVVAAAVIGLVLGLLLSRVRRRTVDPDDAALLRQGWRVDEPVALVATAAPAEHEPVAVAAPVPTSDPEPVPVPVPVPVLGDELDVAFAVGPLVDPALRAPDPAVAAPQPQVSRRTAVAAPPTLDDLTAISGIDPDVAALLRAHGIGTWARLGASEVGELRRLLDTEGPRFHACQPGTWPIQGRLLANGEWGAWRSLVDGLRDGRPIWR
jgi:predicted flap endonuclease-1-like 5' DNA nuclease